MRFFSTKIRSILILPLKCFGKHDKIKLTFQVLDQFGLGSSQLISVCLNRHENFLQMTAGFGAHRGIFSIHQSMASGSFSSLSCTRMFDCWTVWNQVVVELKSLSLYIQDKMDSKIYRQIRLNSKLWSVIFINIIFNSLGRNMELVQRCMGLWWQKWYWYFWLFGRVGLFKGFKWDIIKDHFNWKPLRNPRLFWNGLTQRSTT